MLCVASDRDVRVWEYNSSSRRWVVSTSFDGFHTDLVHDVCWAPNLGRAYHLVATACKDGCVRIFKIGYNKINATYVSQLVAKLPQHGGAEVWRVSWNVSGTILASTGDDGVSRLWKADFNGNWHPILVAAATPTATATATAAGGNSVAGPLQGLPHSAYNNANGANTTTASSQSLHRLSSAPHNNSASAAAAGSSAAAAAAPSYPSYAPPPNPFQPGVVNVHSTLSFNTSGAAGSHINNYNKTAPAGGIGGISRGGEENEVKFTDHRSFN